MSRAHSLSAILAVAAALSCGGGNGGGDVTSPNPPGPNTVSIVNGAQAKGTAAFNPNPITVSLASGGTVTWRNDDRTDSGDPYGGPTGTLHFITDDGLTYSGRVTPGGVYAHAFGAESTYTYHCSIHPAMKGTVTVTP